MLSSFRSIVFASALLAALPAAAEDTVSIGNMTKHAFGTPVSFQDGDRACLITFEDDRGRAFRELADFELCAQEKSLKGKRLALTYKATRVQSPSCQGDPDCKKSDLRRPGRCGEADDHQEPRLRRPLPVPPPQSSPADAGGQAVLLHAGRNGRLLLLHQPGQARVGLCVQRCRAEQRLPAVPHRQSRGEDAAGPHPPGRPDPAAAGSQRRHALLLRWRGRLAARLDERRSPSSSIPASATGGRAARPGRKPASPSSATARMVANLKCTGKPISLLGPDWFTKAGIKSDGQDFDLPEYPT